MNTNESNKAVATSRSDGSAPACPAGTHWDDATQSCVADSGGVGAALSEAQSESEVEES